MKQAARDRMRAAPSAPAIFASDVDRRRRRASAGATSRAAQRRRTSSRRAAPTCSTRAAPASTGIAGRQSAVRRAPRRRRALAAFYPQLGDALKQRFAGWTAYLLTGDLRLPKLIGLKPTRRTPLYNGAARMPAVRVPARRRVDARTRREAPDVITQSCASAMPYAALPVTTNRITRSSSANCSRSGRWSTKTGARAARSGGTSSRAISRCGARWTKAACRRRATSTRTSSLPAARPARRAFRGRTVPWMK